MSSINIIEFAEESDYVYMPTEPQSPTFAPIITIDEEKPVLAKIPDACPEEDDEEEYEEAAEVLAANVALIIGAVCSTILATIISLYGRLTGIFAEKPLDPEFIAEVARLNCLAESMEYNGAEFISAVCPPLQPNSWNIVAVIPCSEKVKQSPGLCHRMFNWVNSLVILAAAIMSALCAGMLSLARRVQTSFYVKEAPSAEFLEETARLACLLQAELYDGDNFTSTVCSPLMATPWNIIAIIPEPEKPESSSSFGKSLLTSAKAHIATLKAGIIGVFLASCKLLAGLMPAAHSPSEFEIETTRLGCLMDSMEYCGDAFVSSVCPPLIPTQWNSLVAIDITEQQTELPSPSKAGLMAKTQSYLIDNIEILLSISATAMLVFL